MRSPVRLIARFTTAAGELTAVLTLVMVLVTFVVVVLRYLFDAGWIWLQESVTWMHAAVFMLGAAYTLARDEHVRVDIFYRKMSPRGQAIVDLFGTLLFLVPVAVFMLWSSWSYVGVSWSIRESSQEAGGLIFPLISLWKTFIPLMAVLLLLQAVVIIQRRVRLLLNRAGPSTDQDRERG